MHRLCFVFGVLAVSVSYACSSEGETDDSPGPAASTGGEVPCASPDACPGSDDVCQTPTCTAGKCGLDFTPDGTPLPTDTVGDCSRRVCDGAGSTKSLPDATDAKADALECTVDACQSDGSTTFTPKPTGAECTEKGGRFCHDDGQCRYCAQPSTGCDDTGPGEPNDSEAAAHDLGTLGDVDGGAPRLCGVLPGADEDWYTFLVNGSDAAGRVLAADASVEVCKYVECLTGTTELTCPAGTTDDVSAGGRAGCCKAGGFDLPGGDLCPDTTVDDLRVFVRTRSPGASSSACAAYDLELHP